MSLAITSPPPFTVPGHFRETVKLSYGHTIHAFTYICTTMSNVNDEGSMICRALILDSIDNYLGDDGSLNDFTVDNHANKNNNLDSSNNNSNNNHNHNHNSNTLMKEQGTQQQILSNKKITTPSLDDDMAVIVDDMVELFDEMKHRNRTLKQWIVSLIFLFITSSSCFIYLLYSMKEQNEYLMGQLEAKSNREESISVVNHVVALEKYKNIGFEEQKNDDSNDNDTSMFEIDNCYINAQATISLGQCSKSLYEKFRSLFPAC